MADTMIIPTRMELLRLKKKLVTAIRGHKLLKDKHDEIMRRFLELVRECRLLREKTEKSITEANKNILRARLFMTRAALETALLNPERKLEIDVCKKNIMNIEFPEFKIRSDAWLGVFSYGFAFTNGALDSGLVMLYEGLTDMLKLCEKENALKILTEEIEKIRRRVNALEHIMIPRLRENIRFIAMKLEENERSAQARLMKVKDMMIEK